MVDKKYSLMSLIGIGQQGEVYKVKSGLVEYAMKVIRHHKKTNINEILDIYRIASDAEIGPRVYDMGHCTTQKNVRYSYIIMDLIEPTSLPIRGELNLQLFLNTLSLYWKLFLNHGIQHNDYKPDNFMLHGGRLYLIDYDSAFKTQVTSYTIKKYYRSTTIGHYIRRYSNYQELDKLYDKYWKYIKEQYRKFIEHSIALSLSSGKVPIDLVETFDNNKVNHIAILDHPSDGERPKFSCREGVYIRLYEWDGYPKPTVYLTRQELKEFLLRSVRDCNLVYPSFRRILIRTDNNHVYEHHTWDVPIHPDYLKVLNRLHEIKQLEIPGGVNGYDIIYRRDRRYKWEPFSNSQFREDLPKYPTYQQVHSYVERRIKDGTWVYGRLAPIIIF